MTVPILGGKPLKFKSVKILKEKIDAYFVHCDKESQPYTVSGLAYFLDTDRALLMRYQRKDKYYNTIKRAKCKIEAYVEGRLFENNVAGPIFNLKNNFGWKDQQAHEIDIGPEAARLADKLTRALLRINDISD